MLTCPFKIRRRKSSIPSGPIRTTSSAMSRKTLKVQVELEIQAVTCPGVWLCPSGKLSLQVCMLDSCIQTIGLLPNFPLLYHEKYAFYKVFHNARSLSDLHRLLNEEYMYAELIQWKNCETGNVMASFQTSLCDVLYPTACDRTVAGVDVDLLMEPSKNFPGIISPKIEISTRTTVEETVCQASGSLGYASAAVQNVPYVVNPKTVPSDQPPCAPKRNQLHQQKVCHSLGYHRTKKCLKPKVSPVKPPFTFRKVEEGIIGRKPTFHLDNGRDNNRCTCPVRRRRRNKSQSPPKTCFAVQCDNIPSNGVIQKPSKRAIEAPPQICMCGGGHATEDCPVCSRYTSYFENERCITNDQRTQNNPKINCVRRIRSTSQIRPANNHDMDPIVDELQPIICACCSKHPKNKNSTIATRPKRLSLAEKLHSRLTETLGCTSGSNYSGRDASPCSCYCKNGNLLISR